MTLSEITNAMSAYAAQRNTAGLQTMQGWFSQGNMFPYLRDNNNKPPTYWNKPLVHAYPGIDTSGKLVFFVISAYQDVSTNSNIANDVQVCYISNATPSATSTGGGLPAQEALNRINAWDNQQSRNAWLSANIGAPNSIFQGFVIPQDDTSIGTIHNGFLALRPDANAPAGAIGEVIVEDVDNNVFAYFDTTAPIPPYGGAPYMEESCFYLLSLV